MDQPWFKHYDQGVPQSLKPYPDKPLYAFLEESAAKYPDKVAIHFKPSHQGFAKSSLTYRELNDRANQLAHCLLEQGVVADTLVGLYVERGIEMVVGVLAILKAGGAYVPLDPAYPRERLAYMLGDSRPPLVLTQPQLQANLPLDGAKVVNLDSGWQALSGYGRDNPRAAVQPAHLAYVIYTSGSTGQPKGVQIAHRGACNLAVSQQAMFGVADDSRVLGFASLSFDAATFEWIMALLRGAAFHVCTEEQRHNPAAIQTFLREHGITHATLPPALLPHLDSGAGYALETLVLAGETCGAQVVAPWLSVCRVFNAYGPTESTVWVSTAETLPP